MNEMITVTKNDESTVKVSASPVNCHDRRCSSCGTRNNVSWLFYRYKNNVECTRYAICPACAKTSRQAIKKLSAQLVRDELTRCVWSKP